MRRVQENCTVILLHNARHCLQYNTRYSNNISAKEQMEKHTRKILHTQRVHQNLIEQTALLVIQWKALWPLFSGKGGSGSQWHANGWWESWGCSTSPANAADLHGVGNSHRYTIQPWFTGYQHIKQARVTQIDHRRPKAQIKIGQHKPKGTNLDYNN